VRVLLFFSFSLDFVNQRFAEHGGAKQLDKVLVNQLDVVLNELSDAMWA
jgi:type I restriction enzyme R subunit